MKKFIAFICALVMLISMLPSVVSASTVSEWGNGTKTNVTNTGSTLLLDSTNGDATYTKGYNFSDRYTVKMTMRIVKYQSTIVLNLMAKKNRAGFYLQPDRISPHQSTSPVQRFYVNLGSEWHDYRAEVDTTKGTTDYYLDGNFLGTVINGEASTTQEIKFAVVGGSILEIENISVQNYDNMSTSAVISNTDMPEDYTPAFTTDWKESTDDWYIYDGPEVYWDKENGTVEYNVVDGATAVLYTVQRTIKAPDDYDFSFDLKVESYGGLGPSLAIDGGGFHTYYYLHPHKIITDCKDSGTQIGIPINLGNDWHTYTFKKRGEYLSILVDGGEVHTIKMTKSSQSILRIAASGAASDVSRQSLGKCVYTPYFPEVTLQKPMNRSNYAENSNIELQAKPETETEYVDYYVNNVKVGRGYAPDYKYVLKNANVGTYKVKAVVGDKSSTERVFFVKAPYEARVELSKERIKLGESVDVNINPKDFSSNFKITKAEYFVNNKLVASSTKSPFKCTINDLKVGTPSIHAKLYNESGSYVLTEAVPAVVWAEAKSGLDITREYVLDYENKSGSGTINIEDGYFRLAMEHKGESVSYETIDGTKSYAVGTGKYKVVVSAGVANVYYNGHFAFSFAMARTQNANKLSFSGIEGATISGTGDKAQYFHKDWKGEADYTEYLDDFGHRYALALDPTEKRIAVNQKNNLVNYTLEFDKKDLSDEKIVYYDGEYRFVLDFKDGKIHTEQQIKKADNMNLRQVVLENDATPGYYRVSVARGYAQVYADNKFIGVISAAMDAHRQCLKRTMTNPASSTFIAIKGSDDTYYHFDDFSGNTEFEPAEYWQNDEAVNAEIVKDGNESVLKLTGKGNYYLKAFTQDSVVKFRAKVAQGSDFYFLSRYSPRFYLMRTGYDAKAKQWYLEADNYHPYDGTKATYSKDTFAGNFTYDEWHDFEYILKDHTATLKCDGKVVFSKDEFFFNDAGNSGFGLNSGTIYVDDFFYSGRGKASPGMIFNRDASQGYHDFYSVSSGRVYATNSRQQTVYTDDQGQTWSEIQKGGNGPNITRLQSGKLFKCDIVGAKAIGYISEDEGATWSAPITMTEREASNRVGLNGALRQAKNGRLYFTTDEGGSENKSVTGVYYSDDEGLTWTESETILDTNINGVNVQEVNLIDFEDGRVRLYGRSERGFIQFVESLDGGKTFPQDGWQSSQLMASLCTFMIQRDNSTESTYYAVISYATENSWLSRYGAPRARLAFLVSYDGCKTWNYAGDLLDSGDYPIGLFRNNSMDVIDGKLYVSLNLWNNVIDAMLVTIDLSKVKPLARWEECSERYFCGGIRADEFIERYTVISKNTGKALVNGNCFDATVSGGMADSKTLSRAVGADLIKNGNTVTFKLGDGTVKFTEGQKTYEVNGETKTAESVCMSNGLIDIKLVAEVYGKPLYETDNSYTLYFDNMFNKQYADQIANMI